MTLADLHWKVGDLGRFSMEGDRHPRFEVLGENPAGAIIWYAGAERPQIVPWDTFKAQCVNYWTIARVVPEMPAWVRPGASFVLEGTASRITQAEVTVKFHRQLQIVDLDGKTLRIRSIRLDHASCLIEAERQLALIPLRVVLLGAQMTSSLDVIMSDELDILDEKDQLDVLLRDL